MNIRLEDIEKLSNTMQPYLTPALIPTIFSGQSVEIVSTNLAEPCAKLKNNHFQVPTTMVNLVGNTPVLQATPMILIPTQISGQLSTQFSTQFIAENLNHPHANNSLQISGQLSAQASTHFIADTLSESFMNNSVQLSADYMKHVGGQQLQIPLNNSVQYLQRGNPFNSLTSVQSSVQINSQDLKQIGIQNQRHKTVDSNLQITVPKQICEQYPNQTQNLADISQNDDCSIRKLPGTRMYPAAPKLRKILPKPQSFNPDTLPNVRISRKWQSSCNANSIPKPDIVIVPKFENLSTNGSGKLGSSRYPGNKRPILRISINKEYSRKAPEKWENDERNSSKSDTEVDDSSEDKDSSTREMTIENSTTNKAVTFKLDPESGEITVTTRQLNDSIKEEPDCTSTTVKKKVEYSLPTAARLRELYIKGQQECVALRRKLRLLRQYHQQEQEEIQMLEEHLSELGGKDQRTCQDKIPGETLHVKRKDVENGLQLDEYEILIRNAKKTRFEGQEKSSNERREQSVAIRNNGTSIPRIENNLANSTIADLCNEEAARGNPRSCDRTVSKLEKLDTEDPVYRAEFLENDFLMG